MRIDQTHFRLTDKQRKQVSLAIEKKELEIKKAYEEDKE